MLTFLRYIHNTFRIISFFQETVPDRSIFRMEGKGIGKASGNFSEETYVDSYTHDWAWIFARINHTCGGSKKETVIDLGKYPSDAGILYSLRPIDVTLSSE